MATARRPKKLRLGIYGGTFDPVHLGHFIQARDALEQLKLDAVMFVPCGRSPFKSRNPHVSDVERLSMLRAALKPEPRFWLTRCEVDRPAPSYAIDTAKEIGEAFPNARLFWLIGADQLKALHKWHRYAELRELVQFAVLHRGEMAAKDVPEGVLSLPHARQIDISATEIRHRVKADLPIDHLLPTAVASYIKRHGLYL